MWPQNPDYHRYGGRGVTVCKRWDSFAAFAADMGPHPGRGWMLDRKNSDGNYSKSNCRWATPTMQSRNRDYCKLTLAAAATIRRRYIRGINAANRGNSALLATEFGVDVSHIRAVIRHRVWK
jgi:hypothetical protein